MGIVIKYFNAKSFVVFLATIYFFSICCSKDLSENNFQREYEKKIIRYTNEIKDDPNNVWSYYARGGAYYLLKKYDKAIDDFKKAISIDNNMQDSFAALSRAYAAKAEYKKALKSINTALRLGPNTLSYHLQRAICYEHLNNKQKAIEDYSVIIKSRPIDTLPKEYTTSLLKRSLLNYQLHNYEESIKDINVLLQHNDNDPKLYCIKGIMYLEMNKYDMALAELNTALKKNPDYSIPLAHIAMVYAAKNDKDMAEKYLVKSLEKGFVEYELIYSNLKLVKILGKKQIDTLIKMHSRR